jgi:hypothetical protein
MARMITFMFFVRKVGGQPDTITKTVEIQDDIYKSFASAKKEVEEEGYRITGWHQL